MYSHTPCKWCRTGTLYTPKKYVSMQLGIYKFYRESGENVPEFAGKIHTVYHRSHSSESHHRCISLSNNYAIGDVPPMLLKVFNILYRPSRIVKKPFGKQGYPHLQVYPLLAGVHSYGCPRFTPFTYS